MFVTPRGDFSPSRGAVSPIFIEETVVKEAFVNVVTDLRLMVLIVVVSQVIAIAKTLA